MLWSLLALRQSAGFLWATIGAVRKEINTTQIVDKITRIVVESTILPSELGWVEILQIVFKFGKREIDHLLKMGH